MDMMNNSLYVQELDILQFQENPEWIIKITEKKCSMEVNDI